jgi:hypothetical protein
LAFDGRARLAHARPGVFSGHSIVYLSLEVVGARCGPLLLRMSGALIAMSEERGVSGFHIEGEPFSLKRREVEGVSCGGHMNVSKSIGWRCPDPRHNAGCPRSGP